MLKTRIAINARRLAEFGTGGWHLSTEAAALYDLSRNLFDQATKTQQDPEHCARICQRGLVYALSAGEMMEVEKARFDVARQPKRNDFYFGCDARGYFQMDNELFHERFDELFNYATITHYLKGDFIDFEPQEGQKQFKERDALLTKLRQRSVTVEGRPLFWVHTWVTPEWLKNKSYNQLLIYVERHVNEVVSHYGDQIAVWEVVNEMHDWANEVELNHKQTIEVTKLALDTARAANPKIKLLINNCCPYADYVQKGKWHDREAKYPQRTPHQFTRQLIEAGADFDLIGVQVYFVKRTFSETVRYIERYREFGKKIHLAEIGSPSRGISQEFLEEETDFSTVPYEWRRHWDEELQADWLEYIFSYAYSRPFIEAANWYDFLDPYGFLKSGGIMRSPQGEKKAAFLRLKKLRDRWL